MRVFVTGTDTGVGKTVVSAWLMLHLEKSRSISSRQTGAPPQSENQPRAGNATLDTRDHGDDPGADAQAVAIRYWKPVQAGHDGETDAAVVRRLAGMDANRILPSAYDLPEPLSPHEAARRAGLRIDMGRIRLPEGPLVVEGAGGLLVPLNDDAFVIDLIAQFGLPVVVVCRTTLGTINHTLLSLEALRRRHLTVLGVILNGPLLPHNRSAIERYGNIRILAHIPPLEPLTKEALLRIQPEWTLNGGEGATP